MTEHLRYRRHAVKRHTPRTGQISSLKRTWVRLTIFDRMLSVSFMKSFLLSALYSMHLALSCSASLYDIPLKDIDDKESSLKPYQGKVLLIVNVASKCGLTPQYTALQGLQEKYKDKGFSVLAFPCNQFGGQEPGSNKE